MITESFVRWAGGKSWLVPHIKKLIAPIQINHYHEPFLGGAATFFALDLPRRSYLSDVNDDLINAYLQIKESPEEVIQRLDGFQNTNVSLADLKQVSISGNHWTSLFEPIITRPEEDKLSGGKEAKTEWLTKIETIERKMQNQNYSVSVQDFEFIKSIHAWLCAPKI